VERVWGKWLLRVVMRPCECWAPLPREMRVKDIIAHLFDVHVAGKKNWTLDQLVAWVQTWEPKEIARSASLPQDLQERLEEAKRTLISSARMPETRAPAISPDARDGDRQAEQEWQRVRQAFAARQKTRRSSPKIS